MYDLLDHHDQVLGYRPHLIYKLPIDGSLVMMVLGFLMMLVGLLMLGHGRLVRVPGMSVSFLGLDMTGVGGGMSIRAFFVLA